MDQARAFHTDVVLLADNIPTGFEAGVFLEPTRLSVSVSVVLYVVR